MRAVLAPVGTRGDVQPMLALGQQLVARGHQVVVCAAENFRGLVEATVPAAQFARGGRDAQALVAEAGERVRDPRVFLRIARDVVTEQFDLLEAACTQHFGGRVDVIVGSPLLLAGPTIAERVGARFCGAAYFPSIYPSTDLPPPIWPRTPRLLTPLAWRAYVLFVQRTIGPIVNGARRARGLPTGQRIADMLAGAQTFCAFDDVLATAPAGWPLPHTMTGFWFADGGAPLPPELVRFLDDGPPPVFIGFGSMPNDDVTQRARTISAAMEQLGCRAVVSAGWAGLATTAGAGAQGGERIHVVGAVDHAQLFSRCAVVVHHGGAGTTAQAARAGVPQVAVPHMFDQHYWADRLVTLGVAPAALPMRFTARALAEAVDDARNRRPAAAALALRMPTTGAADAAALLERT